MRANPFNSRSRQFPEMEKCKIETFSQELYFVLYHSRGLSICRKGSPALPLGHGLVLYHSLLHPQDQQDQSQQGLRRGDFVLHHLGTHGPHSRLPHLSPFSEVRISSLRNAGFFVNRLRRAGR
jgi:hypothetical protein